MTSKQALGEISTALGRLRHEIGLENAAGYLSQNKLLENLLLPVFRIVFGAPHLRNANDAAANEAHIDLVDDATKLAFQVTTDRRAAKITGTLTGFLQAKKQRKYKSLKFFILASQPAKYQAKTTKGWIQLCKGKLEFSPKQDVLQFEELYRRISNLDHPKIVKVRNIIAQSIVGKEHVDVAIAIAGHAQQQVEEERSNGKYIPDIFVETTSAKGLARLFWHPFLFLSGCLTMLIALGCPSSIDSLNAVAWQRFQSQSGKATLLKGRGTDCWPR